MNRTNDIVYVGVNDRRIDLFEGQYPVPNGMSYNSYLILDERCAVMDSVDVHFATEWLKHVQKELQGRDPEYLVIQHMEPDHSGSITAFLAAYPQTKLVATAKAFAMMEQFFKASFTDRGIVVKEGDTLCLGQHTLRFITAPMVHWPEVMVTYDETAQTLFSADAFGKFGALDDAEAWVEEARRYYFGIVGPYGAPVQTLLKKLSGLDVQRICPLHGPILQDKLDEYLKLYQMWSNYDAESDGVLIAYASVYGHTREAAETLAKQLIERGCNDVVLCDLAREHVSYAVGQAFRCRKLVLASPTYNADVFPCMKTFLHHLVERQYQKRTIGLIENGSWAPLAAKRMRDALASGKQLTWLESGVTIRSAMKKEDEAALAKMAEELCD